MSAQLAGVIERVGKALALEARQGHQDRAVGGGVERFAAEHLRPLRGHLPSRDADDRLARVQHLLQGYAALAPAARGPRLAAALGELRALYRLVQEAGVGQSGSRAVGQQDETADGGRQTAVGGRESGAGGRRTDERSRKRDGAAGTRMVRAETGVLVVRNPLPPPLPAAARPTTPASRLPPPDSPVTALPGVGEGRAKQLALLGVRTVRDLLYLLPRRYVDYSAEYPIAAALFGREGTFKGEVRAIEEKQLPTGKSLVVAEIADATGLLTATWFNPYVAKSLHPGDHVALSGTVEQRRGRLALSNPEWEALDADLLHTGRIVPVYPLTKGLYQKPLRALVRKALDASADALPEFVPAETRRRLRLPALPDALRQVHFPDDEAARDAATRRLAFDEFFLVQLGMLRRKRAWQRDAPGHAFAVDEAAVARFLAALPFRLTGAQERVLADLVVDLRRPVAMSRLVQGDVGSGKTVVAAAAMLAVTHEGYQAALMAPTAILAEQHWRTLTRLYADLPDSERPAVRLLIGGTPAKERREIAAGLADGTIAILVGTQALIQGGVEFARLGFAVVDEQHRFGVVQRAALRGKGYNPDVLVMTATPIPRSLALTLHGDLDVSVIDELPPGRQAIVTRVAEPDERPREYRFIREEVAAGRQAFVICPLVEESEAVEARAATEEYERLRREVFPDLRLGLLHGRMRPAEKDRAMAAFRDGDLDLLVSTAVVEVGIDVPNATVMLIEGADRFGLAQLHQFRGRVGRGAARSYCLLLADAAGADGAERLRVMVETQDGFVLAQRDLEMRGPGDFFGVRQSGLPDLQVAQLADLRLLEAARREADLLLDADPDLAAEEHAPLRERLEAFWHEGAGDVS
ncbi:MAG TPA: ATP-dependent DNA helicase RecG [Thermomicrobiales bacterium]|nr:ATP-dependent DNA helicase RecG [Thermomicrobiales bacterium]